MKDKGLEKDWKKYTIIYLGISIIISFIKEIYNSYSSGFSFLSIIVSSSIIFLFGVVGAFVWYKLIGERSFVKGDDLELRSQIILVSILLMIVLAIIFSGNVTNSDTGEIGFGKYNQNAIISILILGFFFILASYYRLKQTGYGLFRGSRSLFSKENGDWVVVIVGIILVVLLFFFVKYYYLS